METQPASANVSMLSQMNAFYGNPNLSQETTTAVFRGAEAPEVYAPETPEQQAQEAEASPSPVENYFDQTTEQLEISEQAAALQQQQGNEAPANQLPFGANEGATPPETLAPSPESEVGAPLQVEQAPQNVPSEIGETKESSPPIQTPKTEPTAVSALNESPTPEPQTASANNQQPENNPLQQNYGQFGAGPTASNASQPGTIFSAMG